MIKLIKKYSLTTLIFVVLLVNSNCIVGQNKNLKTAGDVLLVALPTSAVVATFINNDKQGRWQFTKAFAVNAALTYGLKGIVDKERPDFSGNDSFPSGHTSATFQSASFLQIRYGWKYGIPAYLLAGFTSFTRLNAKKHDGWDVLGGAIIGVGSSYLFTTPYQKEHLELSFNSDKDSYLLGFKYKF